MKQLVSLNLPRNNNATYIGAKNEVIVDNATIYIHDGLTVGGFSFAYANSVSSGILSNSVTINLTGDVTGTASGNTLNVTTNLASILTSGTYNNVITDSKGRVISGSNINYPTSNSVSINLSGDLSGSANGNNLNVFASLKSVTTAGTYTTVITDTKGRIISGNSLLTNTVVMSANQIQVAASNASGAVTVLSITLPLSGIYGITYVVRAYGNSFGGVIAGLYVNGNTTSGSATGGTLIANSEILCCYGQSGGSGSQSTGNGFHVYTANSANTIINLGIWGDGVTSNVYAFQDSNGRTTLNYVKIG